MQVYTGLEMLEISAVTLRHVQVIHPTLIWDHDTVVLVDTGYPGQLPLIREAMRNAGLPLDRLNKIIVTHQDIDHIGSLPAILSESVQAVEVVANAIEVPFIQGEKTLLKLTPVAIAEAMRALPTDVPEQWRQAFKTTLEHPPTAKVNTTVIDGETLPYCGGISVIDTPGHTPGHISLYHKPSKTLIAGDAMTVVDGQLFGANPQHTLDNNLAKQSLKKLTTYDIDAVVCYHGGLYRGDTNQRILELATL